MLENPLDQVEPVEAEGYKTVLAMNAGHRRSLGRRGSQCVLWILIFLLDL